MENITKDRPFTIRFYDDTDNPKQMIINQSDEEYSEGEQPEIPPEAQLQIRQRIEDVQRRKGAIKEIVTCPECGCLIPAQAGSCFVCANCGETNGCG